MKKIIIIDGGPRAIFNTASMLKKFAEGADSVSNETKRQYREEHWEEDLQKAFDAGKRMAKTIINK